jgi:16S rRNA (guanine527-N7)-methyltransferase
MGRPQARLPAAGGRRQRGAGAPESASIAPALTAARAALASGARALGFPLSEAQLDAFDEYARLLQAGRAEANLTALSDPLDVAEKHFLDSLAALRALPAGPLHLIDVGTGAGLPGIPLKLARPDLHVALVEATGKKVAWLQRTIATLGLDHVEAIADRAETLAHLRHHRAAYDVAVARAVAPLAVLCELCLPFLRPGGRFIALKTAAGAGVEAPQAGRALELLGGRLVAIQPAGVPALPNRVLVIVEQVAEAPERYPRRPGMPAKRPL